MLGRSVMVTCVRSLHEAGLVAVGFICTVKGELSIAQIYFFQLFCEFSTSPLKMAVNEIMVIWCHF